MKSDNAKTGYERSPHRSLFRAMGYTDEELARPIVGIVNSKMKLSPDTFTSIQLSKLLKQACVWQEEHQWNFLP